MVVPHVMHTTVYREWKTEEGERERESLGRGGLHPYVYREWKQREGGREREREEWEGGGTEREDYVHECTPGGTCTCIFR